MKTKLMLLTIFMIFSLQAMFISCGNPWLDSILSSGNNKKDDTTSIEFTSIDKAIEWLNSQPGGGSATNPVSLNMKIPLGNMPSNEWVDLLNAIGFTGKYVNLDLSACALNSPYMFDPAENNSTAKYQITSLILPNQAQTIVDNSPVAAFNHFSSLTHVSGTNINTIGVAAFYSCNELISVNFPAAIVIADAAFENCPKLENVNIPKAEYIGGWSFEGCVALKTINFPEAVTIDYCAFSDCQTLIIVNLPKAEIIGGQAFTRCYALLDLTLPAAKTININAFYDAPALTRVILPKAESIGTYAFQECEALINITLGPAAPTLGTDIFTVVGPPVRSVIVSIPSGATGYGLSPVDTITQNWGNAFRGMGWDGTSYLTGSVNPNINLIIQNLP
ncbi:MAG: leucine-rich repeat domain-containing protein [Spirochaetaceae bacterium]|nr:leucine-rich repeat domain-containing protein [Spirochaetaceae bacterium]